MVIIHGSTCPYRCNVACKSVGVVSVAQARTSQHVAHARRNLLRGQPCTCFALVVLVVSRGSPRLHASHVSDGVDA